jgi:GNAT superfamily N-acetyltransferase
MDQKVVVRAMRAEDMTIVLGIQACCYDEAKLESLRSFLAKIQASPTTCFIALVAGAPAGYLVAVPAEVNSPPPLHGEDYHVPPNADALYLHDLAVHPEVRGSGIAAVLIEAYFQAVRQQGFRLACLTAVNGAGQFWERYGFRAAAGSGADGMASDMASYGAGAVYMSMRVDG